MWLTKKEFEIITNIEDGIYTSKIIKKVDSTWDCVHKIIKKFEKKGLIKTEKKGRIKIITLTKKGNELKEVLYKVKTCLNNL